MEKIFFILAFGSFIIAFSLLIFTLFLKDTKKILKIQFVSLLISIFSIMNALVLLIIN